LFFFLAVPVGSGLKVALAVARLRGVFTGGVFFVVARLEVFVIQGELLAPLILGALTHGVLRLQHSGSGAAWS
jgi:hypothetical protein